MRYHLYNDGASASDNSPSQITPMNAEKKSIDDELNKLHDQIESEMWGDKPPQGETE